MASSMSTALEYDRRSCATVPDFTRLTYFHGQFLTAHDLQMEQAYFREKLKLHNRCLHGYGIVCGLEISAVPPNEECPPGAETKDQDGHAEPKNDKEPKDDEGSEGITRKPDDGTKPARHHPRVRIDCGMAIDCWGNEIVVRTPVEIDLWRELSAGDREKLEDGWVYVSLCYCEQRIEPTRSLLPDQCGPSSDCVYSKAREAFGIRVTASRPHDDHRCDACCEQCADPCVLLARIGGVSGYEPVTDEVIDATVRRIIGPYEPTTITGIGWQHGATYSSEQAGRILGESGDTCGIKVAFSREVDVSTLLPGVVDLYVVEGGAGRAAADYFIAGEFVDLPESGYVTSFCYRQTSKETLQSGDRLMVVVRTPFILDACCEPVDGLHVGGRVPLLPEEEFAEFAIESVASTCLVPPSGTGRWRSGNGSGGVFESWFFVE